MKKDDSLGLILILGIIAIALFGGAKNSQNFFGTGQSQNQNNQQNIERQIQDTQIKVDDLKKQIQEEEDKKTRSKYYNQVQIQYINRSDNPSYEYVAIKFNDSATTTIDVTGWQLKSLSSGSSVTIPKGTQLFFANTPNYEEDIVLIPGDLVYLVTGVSPNGSSFRVNKCSGYLSQFQTFIPYLSTNCPAPRNEDLSSIPKIKVNYDCLDYIQYFPSCRIQTTSLPINWSYECTDFIYKKINYPSCVDAHKNEKDFYQKEWRVYLKRSESVWEYRRENVVLYDNQGKVVSSIQY